MSHRAFNAKYLPCKHELYALLDENIILDGVLSTLTDYCTHALDTSIVVHLSDADSCAKCEPLAPNDHVMLHPMFAPLPRECYTSRASRTTHGAR